MDPSFDNLFTNLTVRPNEHGSLSDAVVVIFHLDTTEICTRTNEIYQIAAWCKGEEFMYECILPDCEPGSNLRFNNVFQIKNKRLFYYGMEVDTVTPQDGLQKFLDFLNGLTGRSGKVLLAAHNCSAFHRHIIVRLIEHGLLETYQSLVLGFIDTVDVFRAALPHRVTEKKSFKLRKLENNYLDTNTTEKHAIVNVLILVDLIEKINCTDVIMKQHVRDLDVFIRFIDLQPDFDNAVSNDIQKKIANAGITTDMLKDAYRANPDVGVSNLLQENVIMKRDTINKITEKVAQ